MTHQDHHTPAVGSRQRRRPPLAMLSVLAGLLALSPSWLAERLRQTRQDQAGNVITDNLGMIILGVAAIVAIMAGLQAAGVKVVNDITKTLGI